MFYVIKKEKGKNEKIPFETEEKATEFLNNYIMKDTNYSNIKMLGNGKVKIERFFYDTILQIVEE